MPQRKLTTRFSGTERVDGGLEGLESEVILRPSTSRKGMSADGASADSGLLSEATKKQNSPEDRGKGKSVALVDNRHVMRRRVRRR